MGTISAIRPNTKTYEIFTRRTKALIFGLQVKAIQRMLDFDYAINRSYPSVAAIVNPGKSGTHKVFWGTQEILIPLFPAIAQAVENCPDMDVMINFASHRSAFQTTLEALEFFEQIRTIVIIAEGVPEGKAKRLKVLSKDKGVNLIGPATVGGIKAGAFKVGNAGGTIENIMESNLHRPGSVGFVSKSGGMSNECYNIIARNTNGVYEGIAIGGDAYPGSSLLDHLLRYEADPNVKMMVCLGEVGGEEEYKVANAVKDEKITKPLVMWVTGTCASVMPREVQFGHAGAKAGSERESAASKNRALKESGVIVPQSFNDFDKVIKQTFDKLSKGYVNPKNNGKEPNRVPADYASLAAAGAVRRPSNFRCTICDDSGDELLYAGHKISHVIEKNYSIGDVIGLLWFKEKLPPWATQFMEMVLKLTADHGPAVSGAHNTIVTARAGRDLMSSVASGLLTIGPRFGGAVAGAAIQFKDAVDSNLSPKEFVSKMKKENKNIQGIGHRVKSLTNPDMRVKLLKEYAVQKFPFTTLLSYALEVEAITTMKKETLILNVDGAIGILCVDMMYALEWPEKRIRSIIDCGGLNGLFVLGRTMGMIGHYIDQVTQQNGLYRHPWDDIMYDLPKVKEIQ